MLSYVRGKFKEIIANTRDLTFEFHAKAFCKYQMPFCSTQKFEE